MPPGMFGERSFLDAFSARRAALSFGLAMRACSRCRLVIVGRDRCAISILVAPRQRGGEVSLILPARLGAPARPAIRSAAAEPTAAARTRCLRPRFVDRQRASG